MLYLTAFCVSFVFVGLKSLQQLNVVQGRYLAVMPVSMLLAVAEVTIIASVVKSSLIIALPIGLGGGLGCCTAIFLNRRFTNGSRSSKPATAEATVP